MSTVRTYEAESDNLRERFRYISSIISDGFSSSYKAEPIGDLHQSTRISSVSADGVAMCRAQMTPLRLVNNGKAATNEQRYFVSCLNRRSTISVGERSPTVLQPHDMIVFRNDQAIDWMVPENYQTTSLIIDGTLFHEYIPPESDYIGRRISMPFCAHDLLLGLFETAWNASCAGLFEEAGPKLARSFLGLLSIASLSRTPTRGEDTISRALDVRRSQIKAYINQNFSAPDLSSRSISRNLGVSSRYVQLALAAENVTPSDYIRETRLKNSADMLSDGGARHRSVTEIAYTCGFNSSSHFSTVFKKHFGCSPRDFREASRR